MRLRLSAKLREAAGQSTVELALVLPVLVVLAFGVYDFSRAILANNAVINMSREGASLASRSTRDPQDVMDALAFSVPSLPMKTDGMMYITKGTVTRGVITYPDAPVAWQGNTGDHTGMGSDFGDVAKPLAGMDSQNRPLLADGNFYVFEVYYRYTFLLGTLFPGASPKILHSTTIL